MTIKLLSSPSELVPSKEGTEMAAVVSHILGQTQNPKTAFDLARTYASEHGLNLEDLQVAIGEHFIEPIEVHRARAASTLAKLRSIREGDRKFHQVMDGVMGQICSPERTAWIRSEAEREERERNSTPAKFRVLKSETLNS